MGRAMSTAKSPGRATSAHTHRPNIADAIGPWLVDAVDAATPAARLIRGPGRQKARANSARNF